MSKLDKTFSFISVACVILIFSFAFYYIWKTAKKAILRSCISSVVADIAEYENEIGNLTRNGENWYVLTDNEANSVFSNESITFRGCSRFKNQPQDLKDRSLKIAVKKIGESSFMIIVWSKGFDNVSGTEDDIGSSWSENIPN